MPASQHPGQRTLRDITALVMPAERNVEPGDEVEINTRHERLAAHGWIDTPEHTTELTEDGAAIVNAFYDAVDDGTITQQLEEGAGHFVTKALEERTHDHDVTEWHVEDSERDRVVLRGECDICGEEITKQAPMQSA